MHSEEAFQRVREILSHELAVPLIIKNWTIDHGYLGEDFTAHLTGITITCVLPNNNEIHVPEEGFAKVYGMWSRYLTKKVARPDIRDETRFSKYIISIFHQFLSTDEGR